MRVALVDSGIGLVSYADALATARPDLELVLAMDVDHMPYGPREPDEVRGLILELARSTLAYDPAAVIVACNTASVHGLETVRAALEPAVPVIGTVPAIRPAARTGGPVAIWATQATTGSAYQRRLIAEFAEGVEVYPVACPGLAEAIERADASDIDAAIANAAAHTPPDTIAVVLGCTHFGLVSDQISRAVSAPGDPIHLFDSPEPVARQALRRLGLEPDPDRSPAGIAAVLLSGRQGALPDRLAAYPAGRRLLRLAEVGALAQPRGPHTIEA